MEVLYSTISAYAELVRNVICSETDVFRAFSHAGGTPNDGNVVSIHGVQAAQSAEVRSS